MLVQNQATQVPVIHLAFSRWSFSVVNYLQVDDLSVNGSGWGGAQAEIEKVRKRREERAAERAVQEEELSIMQRERAVLEGIEMEAKEEEVHIPAFRACR